MKSIFITLLFLTGIIFITNSQGKAESLTIHNGSLVAFDYTLTVDGKVVDTSKGKSPLEYTQGDGKLIPGLTKQMEGMRVGYEKTIEVKPEEGYGNPDPTAFKEVPVSSLPANTKPEIGMNFQAKDDAGRVFNARISQVKDNTVIMDFNHPLAGKTLIFNVKIISIK